MVMIREKDKMMICRAMCHWLGENEILSRVSCHLARASLLLQILQFMGLTFILFRGGKCHRQNVKC